MSKIYAKKHERAYRLIGTTGVMGRNHPIGGIVMKLKAALILAFLLLLLGSCGNAPMPTALPPSATLTALPPTVTPEPTETAAPTATRRVSQSSQRDIQLESTEIIPPTATLTASPTPLAPTPTSEPTLASRVLMEPFALPIAPLTDSFFIDSETNLAFELVDGWTANRHNEQTIILNKDSYYIDFYVTDALSSTLPSIPVGEDIVTLEPLYGGEIVREIGRFSHIVDGNRVNHFYADGNQPQQYDNLAFFAVVYQNKLNELTDLPDEIIAEADQIIRGLWRVERFSAEKIPAPSFNPAELAFTTTHTSTDGTFVFNGYFFEQFTEEEEGESQLYQRQTYTVGEVESSEVWRLFDQIAWVGFADDGSYRPLKWLNDKLYFTYCGGSCGAGRNGSDVWSLDFETGEVVQVLPRIGRTFTIDNIDHRLAVAHWDNTFSLYNLQNRKATHFALDHRDFTVSLLEWLPNNEQLLLVTQPGGVDDVDQPKSVYLLDIAAQEATLLNDALMIETLNNPVWLTDHELIVDNYWGEPLGSYLIDAKTGMAEPFELIETAEIVSSTNWIVETLYNQLTMTETLRVRQRGNSAGMILSEQEITLGVGSVETVPQFFSPDETYLYYNVITRSEGLEIAANLQQLNLQTFTTVELPETASTIYEVLPDGSGYAHLNRFGLPDLVIRRFDGSEQRYRFALPEDTGRVIRMQFSADQTRLAFQTEHPIRGGTSYIGIFDLATERITLLLPDVEGWLVGWENDALKINAYRRENYFYLNPITGEISDELPEPPDLSIQQIPFEDGYRLTTWLPDNYHFIAHERKSGNALYGGLCSEPESIEGISPFEQVTWIDNDRYLSKSYSTSGFSCLLTLESVSGTNQTGVIASDDTWSLYNYEFFFADEEQEIP